MFCVIQKIKNKNPNQYGTHKEIIVTETTFGFVGQEQKTSYGYTYSDERFERTILDAYKISIHHSYRENGKVKKKQWAICTISYYDLLEYSLYDCASFKIEKVATETGMTEEQLYDMIHEKLDSIIEQIIDEFIYGQGNYKYCYDVFGNLRNPSYLEKLKQEKVYQEEYRKRSEEEQRKRFEREYNGYSSGSYSTTSNSNYNEDEKKLLHEIYRMASKKFHPDACGDDGSKMKFLTKLKEQWGL